MSPLKIITTVLLIFVAISVGYLIGHREPAAEEVSAISTESSDAAYRVVYFHGNNRCNTCRKLEAFSAEAVKTGFADQLASGLVQWSVLNFEKPENEHFAREFDLYSPALIIMDNGSPTDRSWHNLTEIWDHVGDKDKFTEYVQSELDAFINHH